MKLTRLEVRGFGKITKYGTNLEGGLNIIYGLNESGKSTLQAFINAVFYGLKGGRVSKDGLPPPIRKYKPWGSSIYSGYINIEMDNGKLYRLDRDFENGTVKIFDSSFNDVTEMFSSASNGFDIADKLLGLNENLFERTVFIKQMGTRIDSSSAKDLLERISNIKQSGAEDISYKIAHSALKDAIKQQVGTQRSYTRPLDIINKQLEERRADKSNYHENQKYVKENEDKIADIDEQLEKLINKKKIVEQALEFYSIRAELKIYIHKQEEIEFLERSIKQIYTKQEDIYRELSKSNGEMDSIKNQLSNMSGISSIEEENIEELKILDNDVQRLSNELSSKMLETDEEDYISIKTALKGIDVGLIASVAALIIAAVCAFINKPFFYFLLPVSIIACGVLGWFRQKKNSEANTLLQKTELAKATFVKLKSELESKRKKLSGFLNIVNVSTLQQFVDMQAKHSSLKQFEKMIYQKIISLEQNLVEGKQQLTLLGSRLENLNVTENSIIIGKLEKRLDDVSDKLINFEFRECNFLSTRDMESMETILECPSDENYMQLRSLREVVENQIQQARVDRATIFTTIQQNKEIQDIEYIEFEIERLMQQKNRLEQRKDALSIAINTIEKASQDVQNKYTPIMNTVFRNVFAGLTSQKYCDARAGENLNIMVNEPITDTIIPVTSLSDGTIDQLYLSLRLAISETVLKDNETLPFIMDEPFAQYDDERTENALKHIYEISKKQQVIIFTCKNREVELISSLYPCTVYSL